MSELVALPNNPALCALVALGRIDVVRSNGFEIDRDSFWAVAREIDDFKPGEPGYQVVTVEDIARLTDDYPFLIKRTGTVIQAMTPDMWRKYVGASSQSPTSDVQLL